MTTGGGRLPEEEPTHQPTHPPTWPRGNGGGGGEGVHGCWKFGFIGFIGKYKVLVVFSRTGFGFLESIRF